MLAASQNPTPRSGKAWEGPKSDKKALCTQKIGRDPAGRNTPIFST